MAELGYDIARGRCSNGIQYFSGHVERIKGGAHISSAGKASYSGSFVRHTTYLLASGRKVTGRDRFAFALRFAGDRVTGTLRDSFLSGRLRCTSGQIAFKAYLDGSPRAPLRTAQVSTARYTGHKISLRAFTPQNLVASIKFFWTLSCPRGRESLVTFYPIRPGLPILTIRGRTFVYQGTSRGSTSPGFTDRVRFRLFGRFLSRPAPAAPTTEVRYYVTVHWSYAETEYEHGQSGGTCSAHPVFTAYAPLVSAS